ncbi:MAG: hypothetical protein V3V78_03620 [Candidatus Woesearchaeota archaeon]
MDPEEKAIVDYTEQDVSDEMLMDLDGSKKGYHRLNLEQVQRTVKLIYLPHQVRQWNAFVNGAEVRNPTLSEEGKEVTLEEILPDAMEKAEKLFNFYSSIPAGQYYVDAHDDLEEYRDWKVDTNRMGPSHSIAKKRFDGFVVKELDHWYVRYGIGSFKVPDRRVYVPWDITSFSNPLCLLEPKTQIDGDEQIFSEDELKDLIDSTYAKWKEIFEELRSEKGKQIYFAKSDEEDEEEKELDWINDGGEDEFEGEFDIYTCPAVCRKIGFWPETESISSVDELFQFIVRFTSFKEKGKSFSEND